jgi:ATP-dependent RNA helicase RhlE
MGFSAFGLADTIMQGVRTAGHSVPTEIQHKAIPIALLGTDIIGCAPTGTGKTAAFVLPILHRLQQHRAPTRAPRALILAPTRELTQQIAESATAYGSRTRSRSLSIYGGVDIREQIRGIKRGVEIIVATPGRLLDHLDRRTIDLSQVEILVLDEADRMYDMGFINDVRKIIKHVPAKRQTLLFSATFSRQIRELVGEIQRSPKVIEIGAPCSPASSVEQQFYSIPRQKKTALLAHILKSESIHTMLVFSRTKHGADRISKWLDRKGIRAAALHGNRTQSQRHRALDGFKRGQYRVLVATDIAARGIDVDGISHVVNYDTPAFAEDYVHRIGRTGRGAATGMAITFVSDDEQKNLRRIERLISKRLKIRSYPGFEHSGTQVPEVPRVTVERVFGCGRNRQRARHLAWA